MIGNTLVATLAYIARFKSSSSRRYCYGFSISLLGWLGVDGNRQYFFVVLAQIVKYQLNNKKINYVA